MVSDYKDTLALPHTDFPMKAGLPAKEVEILQKWQDHDLWGQILQKTSGRPAFILHDGPPYANGHLHIGHALNKILKDIINRSQRMTGKSVNYVPVWDCHGLPIEWKIEEQYRAKGMDKDAVNIQEFRNQCRQFASKWVDIQRLEFQRLGVLGDWKSPHLTMDFHAEAIIAREIGKFLMQGSIYRGTKPVLWSVVEKTALAEAEVEYMEHKSITLWVKFPVTKPNHPALENVGIVIWTTTPWTLPANRAIAVNASLDYSIIEVEAVTADSYIVPNQKLAIASSLVTDFCDKAGITTYTQLAEIAGADIAASVCAHPLAGQGYDHAVPVAAADFVSDEMGTGFVHIAPGHGEDDYHLGLKIGLEMPEFVDEEGAYTPKVPLFAGARIYTSEGKPGDANGRVIKAIMVAGGVMAKGSLRHSYPHSWRSKAPLIYRNTPQWFIDMAAHDLRDKALSAIEETRFYPPRGKNRLRDMIANRPDWCISRQRAWGVPLPIFYNKKTGEPLKDQAVIDRVVAAFEQEGADAWFHSDPSRFLGPDYAVADFAQVQDVVDVWFDSGSTHAIVGSRDSSQALADLYLEGSDQHRGWFHSSLLEACGTLARAPFKGILTHGFIMAEDGRKMSKSLGNTVVPAEVNDQYGAEILRVWVVASAYFDDLRIGPAIIKKQVDSYRRLRNTLRWLLGNLAGYQAVNAPNPESLPELEQWVLSRLHDLDGTIRDAIAKYDLHRYFRVLHDFCNQDLSAFYFDIRKDTLYCDRSDDPTRLACLYVLDQLFDHLAVWLAPILCFTAEEAWLNRYGDGADISVHLHDFPTLASAWENPALEAKWEDLRKIRRVILGALEIARAEKRLGSSLQAHVKIWLSDALKSRVADMDFAEISITSQATIMAGGAPESAFSQEESMMSMS